MAIQSAINNMLGTAGTVSALGQHLGEQKKGVEEQNIANTLNAINQGQDIQKEVNTMNEAIDNTLKEEMEIKNEIGRQDQLASELTKPNYDNPTTQKREMTKYEREAAKIATAQDSLREKLKANIMQQELQNKQREFITKKAELYNSVVGDKAPKIETTINQSWLEKIKGGNK